MAVRSFSRGCLQLTTAQHTSAARAFIQLAPRRHLHLSQAPVLDFLVPTISSAATSAGFIGRRVSSRTQIEARRAFISTSMCRGTHAVFNPRQDDDGIDMNVEITPRASNRLKEIMSKDSNPNLALRIQVESGGCHGFQYLMSLTTLPPLDPSSLSSRSHKDATSGENTAGGEGSEAPASFLFSASTKDGGNDTSTASLDEDDTVFVADDGSGAKVVLDGPSLELLKGSKVDYTMELIGSQFKIVDNPLATSSCGCGTSFDIKA